MAARLMSLFCRINSELRNPSIMILRSVALLSVTILRSRGADKDAGFSIGGGSLLSKPESELLTFTVTFGPTVTLTVKGVLPLRYLSAALASIGTGITCGNALAAMVPEAETLILPLSSVSSVAFTALPKQSAVMPVLEAPLSLKFTTPMA